MSEFFDTPLSDVIALQNDKKAQLKTFEYQSSGVLPIIDQSSKFICGYTDDFSKKYSKSLPVIVFGDHTLHTKYIDFDFAVGADGTQIIRTQDPQHEHKYLYYVISREIQIMGSEGYKRHLKILKERVVPFTNSIPEQKKIASILTSVDEVIENTQKQIDKLQDLKKATMNELLTKGIGHTEFKDSELGRIPKSWEVVELSSLVNSTRPITYGIVQTGEHIPYGIPCVRVVDIVKGKPILERMIRTTQQINDSYSRTVLQENDIMFALRGNIGFVRKVESFLRGANLTRGIALISNSEEITSDYLLYALQSQVVRRQIADGVNGSALQEIPLGNLRTVKVPVPCKTEQTGISEVIASLEKLIETSLLKLTQTQSLKKSLMQDLLTGKVRVTVN